jgi:NAD(P)H-dependent flavin oxidoreductase YrpB (nitropropane dioxygenase family)
MKTRITEMLGIKYPIICGGMLWLCKPELCAAISNAGGLGNLTAGNYDTGEEFREAVRQTKALTDKPFGVNISLLPSFRITEQTYDDYFRICCEEKVAAIEVSGMFATKYLDMVKEAGVKIFHKVGAVRHAVRIEKLGYDGVFAAGFEEGGHPLSDDVTTMVLVPRVVESVQIPVVAVGGIADGRGLAAALCLGAEGVMMASRFINTQECNVHQNIKDELIKRRENDTTLIGKSFSLQGRALKNQLTDTVLKMESEGKSIEEVFPLITGQRVKQAWQSGDVESAAFMVGQSIGLINDVPTCKDEEAFAIINESRSKLARAETVGQKAQADADLSRGLSQLCKAVKQHSAIEADTACQQMLNKMTVTEENLATARRDYNEAVRGYNTYIKGFPANIVAGVGGFGRRPYFEAGEMAPIDEQ